MLSCMRLNYLTKWQLARKRMATKMMIIITPSILHLGHVIVTAMISEIFRLFVHRSKYHKCSNKCSNANTKAKLQKGSITITTIITATKCMYRTMRKLNCMSRIVLDVRQRNVQRCYDWNSSYAITHNRAQIWLNTFAHTIWHTSCKLHYLTCVCTVRHHLVYLERRRRLPEALTFTKVLH